jgi:hypothetical protein
MFIRCTQTRSRTSAQSSDAPYTTFRLVQTSRVGGAVRQTTLLNLGSHFDLPRPQWAALAKRIDDLLHGRCGVPDAMLSAAGEALAQRYAAQLIALQPADAAAQAEASRAKAGSQPDRYQEVDLDSLDVVRPRSIGVEHAALMAMRQFGLEDKLAELGLNRPQIAAALGNIIGRMTQPGSELATHAWLQRHSGLGELLGFDFEAMDLNRLYRASDALYKHREALQDHLFAQAQASFGFAQTITLYDLTNTYFEGVAAGVSKAARGRSKECRSDCPLVTLAMALDASGFPRRSRVFAGNASEPATLATMLTRLGAPSGSTVVMDAGIATEANLKWLRANDYHYLVVSRLRERQFDPALATEVLSAGKETIKLQRVIDAQGHVLLYCHSPAREQKDRAIDVAKATGFEAVLLKLQEGLIKPRGTKDLAKIMERIGRAKQRFARAAQHYQVEITKDDSGTQVGAITWTKRLKPGSAAMHPGVYCLRTTLMDVDNATLWRTYTMLTNLESVFRSLKTDLGLRPIFHRVDRRVEGHLFISVLAYHFVHTIRLRLKAHGITESWEALRATLATQRRVTVMLNRRDGRTVHVRKASRPEPEHQPLVTILGLSPNPGGIQRTLV